MKSPEKPEETTGQVDITPSQTDEAQLSRRTVRAYSKWHSQEERDALVKEAQSARQSQVERIEKIEEKIEAVKKRMMESAAASKEAAATVQKLEKELGTLRQSTIRSFLKMVGLNSEEARLELEVRFQKHTLEEVEGTLARFSQTLEALERERRSRSELDAIQKRIVEFYNKQHADALRFYAEQVRIRDVARIASEYHVAFVHGLHPSYTPKQNSLLHNLTDWQTKLKIFLALQPTVSSSTIARGDGPSAMWSRMGVILTAGVVESADEGDAATQSRGTTKRSGLEAELSERKIGSAIRNRRQRNQKNYNELVVSKPEIAGLYFCRESSDEPDLAPLNDLADGARECNLPLYEIHGGQVYQVAIDSKTGAINRGVLCSPDDLHEATRRISDTERRQFLSEVMETSPFKVITQEGAFLNARAGGVEAYLKISLDTLDKKRLGDFRSTTTQGKRSYTVDERGELCRETEAPFQTYPLTDDQKRRFEIYSEARTLHRNKLDKWHQDSGTWLSDSSHIKTGNYFDSATFLAALEYEAENLLKERGQFIDVLHDLPREQVERIKQSLGSQLAFHLRGFADTAEYFGDFPVAKRACVIAERLTSKEIYEEIMQRRVNQRGFFRLTEEDLKLINEGKVKG